MIKYLKSCIYTEFTRYKTLFDWPQIFTKETHKDDIISINIRRLRYLRKPFNTL